MKKKNEHNVFNCVILPQLNSEQFEWELSDDKMDVVFMDMSDVGCDLEINLQLNAEYFKKEKYKLAHCSMDPCDIESVGNLCINELDSDDVNEQWDHEDIREVFMNNVEQIQLMPC